MRDEMRCRKMIQEIQASLWLVKRRIKIAI